MISLSEFLHTKRFRRLLNVSLALIFGGSLLLSYMNWEANHLKYEECTIPTDQLPKLSGLNVLVISDTHSNLDMLQQAVELTENVKPDLVLFLGDLYTDYQRSAHAGKCIQLLRELSAKAPAYACLGNHDMSRLPNVERILKEGGFTILRNAATFVSVPSVKGGTVKLVGLGDLREGDFYPERCMEETEVTEAGEEANPPVIVLSHNPMGREYLNGYDWDLMFSGHTHGGQVKLPFISRPIFMEKDETMSSGLFPYQGKWIFITPGVGYLGFGRLNCPPQINLITIP